VPAAVAVGMAPSVAPHGSSAAHGHGVESRGDRSEAHSRPLGVTSAAFQFDAVVGRRR